jgi:hypothetical protein
VQHFALPSWAARTTDGPSRSPSSEYDLEADQHGRSQIIRPRAETGGVQGFAAFPSGFRKQR